MKIRIPWNRLIFPAAFLGLLLTIGMPVSSEEKPGGERFLKTVKPILENNCYICHGGGSREGNLSLETIANDKDHLKDPTLWWKVLKNVRAGIMPPNGLLRPTPDEFNQLKSWMQTEVFGIDPADPDPGQVTLRRLNRVEYGNTIRDLMGVEFEAEAEFPPDDTGFGFDNNGDVLSLSPLLMEKYLQAAEAIVSKAVPTVSKVMVEKRIAGSEIRDETGTVRGDRMNMYEAATVSKTIYTEHAGDYRILVEVEPDGEFDYDPGRCRVTFSLDEEERFQQEFFWQENKDYRFEYDEKWVEGDHTFTFALESLTPVEQKKNNIRFEIQTITIQGPMDRKHWVHPKNYERFFTLDEPPASQELRFDYAQETLRNFAQRAFRRPVEDRVIEPLAEIAESVYSQPGKTFEEGMARAMTAMLASPRFLFRVEESKPGSADRGHPLVDEYALASRLSYLFWSTMPDKELFDLAEKGELRNSLNKQVMRLMDDRRSDEFIQSFVGQWLQARDVEHVSINERAALGLPRRQRGQPRQAVPELDSELRRAMRRETEMTFAHIMKENRSLLELIDSDYTFLNEKLAELYGIKGIEGRDMRRVELPKDSPRGGVLTQGSMLVVTSNPTRTSPVKRGLFVVSNILGTPAPPAPPNIPELEESQKKFEGREPTVRELMEMHRSQPLCASCHARFDPLGMALENYNALGMWRDKEHNQDIDASGKLITGESFSNMQELKSILKNERRMDFYRCITEKMLTYATGRGLDYKDEYTVDQIVDRLVKQDGQFSALIMGIIESAPFQKRRRPSAESGSLTTTTQEPHDESEASS